jgi:hypothetical protein
MSRCAQFAAAETATLPFNLVISPRTLTVPQPLQRKVKGTGGRFFEFDPVAGTFSDVVFRGNRVVRGK